MKGMTYSRAAAMALRLFDKVKGSLGSIIEKDAEFRKLTVYESSGSGKKLQYVLFGIEFCNSEGSNYREAWIRVRVSPYGIQSELDENSIVKI